MRGAVSLSAVGIVVALLAGSAGGAMLKIDNETGGLGDFSWEGELQPGGTIWFDMVIADAAGESTEASQVTVSVTGPGSLTFDPTQSKATASDANYIFFGNSDGAVAMTDGPDTYVFGDGPADGQATPLVDGMHIARFAFTWDGVVGDYVVEVDPSTLKTFLTQNFATVAPDWTNNPVILHVPEPMSAVLLGLAGLVLVRRRK